MISVQEILLFVLMFIPFFLMHEFFHIKGNGILKTGKIYVEKFSFSASLDENTNEWIYYSGGILTSIYCFLMLLISGKSVFSFALITNGFIQLVYGLYEGKFKGHVRYRYIIYVVVFFICLSLRVLI